MSVLITAKIPKELKEEAKKYSINISKVVREALEREIRRRKIEEIKKLQKKSREIDQKIDKGFVKKALREMRYEH